MELAAQVMNLGAHLLNHFGYERVTLTRGGRVRPFVRHGVRPRVQVDVTASVRPLIRPERAPLYAFPDGGLGDAKACGRLPQCQPLVRHPVRPAPTALSSTPRRPGASPQKPSSHV